MFIQFLYLFFPPVIAVALRNYIKKEEKSVLKYVAEYCLWTIVVNFLIMLILINMEYALFDLPTRTIFALKYLAASSIISAVLAYISCRFKVGINNIYYQSSTTKRKIYYIVKNTVIGILFFLSVLLILSANWILDTFGLITPEKLVFHLKVPLKGTETSMVTKYLISCLLVAIIITAVFIFALIYRWKKEIKLYFNIFQKKLMLIIFPFKRFIMRTTIIFFILSLVYFGVKLDAPQFFSDAYSNSTFIEENFVDIKNTNITFPEEKRNLIFIFLESMENTYMSTDIGGALNVNLIPELTELANNNISFSNRGSNGGAYAVPGTSWTIAGMVSQTAGIPLKIPIQGNTYVGYDSFLPGAYTLGDLLKDQGYNQTLLVGSDAEFAGRKDYFTLHGNFKILDYFTAIEDGIIPEGYKVWWGFEDKYLYEYAKKELQYLSKQDKPFNLTMLTVDTHHVGGYVCDLCKDEFPDQYAKVIACASRQVVEFIEWIKQQDFYEDTAIVIVGDHLSMDPNFFKNISGNYTRTLFNTFINSSAATENIKNRAFCSYDMMPTVLASMGVKIEGDRLALGTNLFSDKQTILEKYGLDKVTEEMNKSSKFYNNKILFNE